MKTMIKANLTALAVVGAIAFPGAYGNTMQIKSFVDEQHEAYHHGGYSPSVVRGTESKIDPPKTRKIKNGKKASSTGQFVPRTFLSHRLYMDWLNSKGWPAISFVEATTPSSGELEENQVGIIVPKFPPGVFDPAKKDQKDELEHIMGIQSRCGEAEGTKITRAEMLACHMYFTPASGISSVTTMTYALGPITLETNLLDATLKGEYRANTVNGLFSFNAMAEMIDRGCFIFNTEYIGSTSTTTSYVDSETYSNEVEKENGIDETAKVGYGPVGVNAGYSQQNKNSEGQFSNSKIAFGSASWEASIGTMTNQCLQNRYLFSLIKDLVDPYVVKQWKSIIKNGAASSDFDAVAMGGVFIPTGYHYGARAGYDITATYEALSSTAASDASKTISAGISGGFGAGTASIQSKVNSAISQSSAKSSINFRHDTETRFVNVAKNVSFTLEAVNEAAREQRKDVNQLGLPTKVSAYTDLATIVNMYFDNDAALGDSFEDGLRNKFAYFTCNSGSYQYFNGFGNEIGGGSCSKAGLTSVPCRAAMHVSPYKPSEPFVPQNPCSPSGGPNPTNDEALRYICNLDQCPEGYNPSKDYCFKDNDNAGKYCWYPTDNLPVGNWDGFTGAGYDNCGPKCTTVT